MSKATINPPTGASSTPRSKRLGVPDMAQAESEYPSLIHPVKGLENCRGLLDKPTSLSPFWRFRFAATEALSYHLRA